MAPAQSSSPAITGSRMARLKTGRSRAGAQESAGIAALFPAAQLGLHPDFAAQPERIAQRGGDVGFRAAGLRRIAEMGVIVGRDLVDLGRRKAGKAVAQPRDEEGAAHVS